MEKNKEIKNKLIKKNHQYKIILVIFLLLLISSNKYDCGDKGAMTNYYIIMVDVPFFKSVLTIDTLKRPYLYKGYNKMYDTIFVDLMWNETKNDPTLVHETSYATGILQITTSWVTQFNFDQGTNYVREDFLDSTLSFKVFILYQQFHNPEADWDYGLRVWGMPGAPYSIEETRQMIPIYRRKSMHGYKPLEQ